MLIGARFFIFILVLVSREWCDFEVGNK